MYSTERFNAYAKAEARPMEPWNRHTKENVNNSNRPKCHSKPKGIPATSARKKLLSSYLEKKHRPTLLQHSGVYNYQEMFVSEGSDCQKPETSKPGTSSPTSWDSSIQKAICATLGPPILIPPRRRSQQYVVRSHRLKRRTNQGHWDTRFHPGPNS